MTYLGRNNLKTSSDLIRMSTISPNQAVSHCMNSRLTYISCFVVITFVILVSQEFTFILKRPRFLTTSNLLQDYLPSRRINITRNISKREPTDDWRPVTDGAYAYAAYWDTRLRNKPFVRFIGGIVDIKESYNTTKCLLKKRNSSDIIETLSVIEILSEHHNKPSKAVYIKCFVDLNEPPTHAAVVHRDWNETWSFRPSWMVVHPLKWDISSSAIGVCIRPMFNYTDAFRIVEFVAYYDALGVSNFIIYNYSVSEDVLNLLYALKAENYSIDVLPWSLPTNLDSMWALGQLASINDCIYRTMAEAKYTVIVDLDEFITPRTAWTLHELLAVQDIPEKQQGCFIVRSSVFCEEYKPDNLPAVIPPFTTQRNIRREEHIYPFYIRSKYIVKPSAVETAGIHLVWKFIPEWKERFIPANQALIHHYRSRICEKEKKLEKGVIDVKSRKYLNQLMRSKALDVWKSLFLN